MHFLYFYFLKIVTYSCGFLIWEHFSYCFKYFQLLFLMFYYPFTLFQGIQLYRGSVYFVAEFIVLLLFFCFIFFLPFLLCFAYSLMMCPQVCCHFFRFQSVVNSTQCLIFLDITFSRVKYIRTSFISINVSSFCSCIFLPTKPYGAYL